MGENKKAYLINPLYEASVGDMVFISIHRGYSGLLQAPVFIHFNGTKVASYPVSNLYMHM